MPTIGGVFVPDNLIPTLDSQPRARPSLGAIFGAAAEGTARQVAAALPYQFDVLTREQVDPEAEASYKQGLAQSAAAFRRAAPAQVSDVTEGRVGVGRFALENLVSSLPQMAAIVGGGAVGGVVGGVPGAIGGAVATGTPIFSASNVARAVEEQGSLDQPAAERSLALAPVQAVADAAVARYLPGVGKILGNAAATQGGNFLRRTAASIVKAGATEAVTEAAQQVGERAAAGIPVGSADAAAEYLNAAVTAFAVGGLLGAGGGFRRTAADAKPADMVTEQDMFEKIDAVLAGRLLPAPPDLVAGPDGVTRVNPAGTQILALPSPDQFAEPDALGDSAGNLALNPDAERALMIERNRPQVLENTFFGNITPEIREILEGRNKPQPDLLGNLPAQPGVSQADLLGSTALGRVAEDPGVAPLAVSEEAARPFRESALDELDQALKDKRNPGLVAAAQRELDSRAAEATGAAPLTVDNFQQRVDELKRGLRGGFVQKLEATTPEELLDKVYDEVFTNANSQSNVIKFAQRVGILDENLKPGPEAQKVEARRAEASRGASGTAAAQPDAGVGVLVDPAPPEVITPEITPGSPEIDPTYVNDWEKTLREAGIQRLRSAKELGTPPNLEVARARVFSALANDKADVEVSQIEKLARKMGLITDDEAMDVTPLGRQAFLSTAEGLEETVSAARQQGFDGKLASSFERGAKAEINGQAASTFEGFDELAAFEAGRVWAKDFVANATTRTAAQTDAIRRRQGARTTGKAVPRKEGRQLTPLQVQQQSLNRLIDAADLTAVQDSDVAALRRMVRDGAGPEAVGLALQRVQQGGSLFEEAAESTSSYTGRLPTRGQPRFRELNTPDPGPAKAQVRAETERAQIEYNLRDLVDFAEAEGGVTERRAQAMREMLDRGELSRVAQLLKDFDPDAIPEPPKKEVVEKIKEPVAVQQAVVHDQLTGREKAVLAKHYGEKTYNKRAKAQFVNDLATAINEGLNKVAETLRVIIRRIEEGVMALALVFNPAALQQPVGILETPTQMASEQVKLPKGVELSATAQQVYKRLAPIAQKRDAGFMIVDKASSKLHMFRADGSHIGSDTVLTGLTQEDVLSAERMAVIDVGAIPNDQRVTPAGTFTTSLFRQSNAEGQPIGLALRDASGENHFIAIHTTVIDSRLQSLGTDATSDNAVTFGCVSVNPEFYQTKILPDIAQFDQNLVFVVPYNTAQIDAMLPADEEIPGRDKAPGSGEKASALRVEERRAAAARTQGGRRRLLPLQPAADVQPVASVERVNNITQNVTRAAAAAAENLNFSEFGQKLRRIAFGWLSHNQLDRLYGSAMPGLIKHSTAHRERVAVRSRWEQMGDQAYQAFEELERSNKNAAEWAGKLMALTTEFQIDPDKAWEDHKHIPERDHARVKPLYDAAIKLKNDLQRGDGAGWKVFNDFRAFNEAQNYARLAGDLHALVAADRELTLGIEDSLVNPVDLFMREEGLTTAAAVRDRWSALLNAQLSAMVAFVNLKKGEAAAGTATDQLAMSQHLSPIELKISAIHEALAGMQKAPYFHLGRFGDYFGSLTVRKQADGSADPEALKTLGEALEAAGFDDVQISLDNPRARVAMRFATKDQTEKFKALALKLKAENVLASDGKIEAGPRDRDNNYGAGDSLPGFVNRYIQAIEASPIFTPDDTMSPEEKAALEKRKNDAVRLAIDTWLEQQPDSSIAKVLVKRYTVPGFNKDMVRNWAHRWRVGSISLANVSAQPKFNEAFIDMRAQLNQAREVTEQQTDNPYLLADLMAEMRRRDATVVLDETADAFDKLRAFGHAYFLGFSPAYGLINMTQLGVTAIPELAKKHGFSKSFHAVRRASVVAGKILKAAGAEAAALGPKHYADVAITEAVLAKANLTAAEKNFVLQMLATGTIDIGSAARALGQIAENRVGSKTDMALKYASAIGMYTETFSRLTAALAARELHGGSAKEATTYAAQVVSNSMFDYQNWNTARQLGKAGFAGPVTPLLTQFMSYSVQMTEKLYSEVLDAAARARPGESAEAAKQRRTEARRFLLGHLTAVTALAGTLGLPFATVFAAVIERLVDAADDDDEPYDATAAWRDFVSDVFGKDMGEAVARGLPRLTGFDVSQRAGEADLLPFSQLIGDRRSWRESVEGMLGRSIGASPNMLLNVVEGGEKFAEGDIVGGLKAIMPVALKGPIETYRMTTEGYVDTKGNRLPMTPAASSYLWQLLGFSPAVKAEYGEARGDQMARRGEISRRATLLRQRIVKAMLDGDQERASELVQDAIAFDNDNPAFAVVPSLAGSIQRQLQARARAKALQTPLGVGIEDIAGQQLTRYANVAFAQ